MVSIAAILLLSLLPEIALTHFRTDVHTFREEPFWWKNQLVESLGPENDVTDRITESVVEEVLSECDDILKSRQELEAELCAKGRVIRSNEKTADISRMRKSNPEVQVRESGQLPFDEASNLLHQRFQLSRDEINNELPTVRLSGPSGRAKRSNCTETTDTGDCDSNTRFRTASGQCNNFETPTWGSAMSCQNRLLPANYEGTSGFRLSVSGDPLPNPRILSLNLHYHYNRPTNYVTHMYMFFGQLLDHDITLTPLSTTENNEAIQCCPPENQTFSQCAPILLPDDDPFYSQFQTRCMNFVRSAICPSCTLGARQLMNQVTSFIDASFIYSNSDNETASLRSNDGTGRLRIQSSNYGDLLPPSPNPEEDQCSFQETNEICFLSGDQRVNQHTVLTSLHTIFVREHNRIATLLRQMNPQWNDERLFQEARRIVGAEMQVITYKEYLPITLGRDRMDYFKLWIGDRTRYNCSENPTMMVEFTTAAFRFGHSLINSAVVNSPLNSSNERRLLRNEFFQPFDLYRGFVGPLLRGTTDSPAQLFDRHLVPDVTNFLYRARGAEFGLDLASININRGRDHGVPTYVEMVRYCSEGQVVVRNFNDLVRYRLMDSEKANALQRNYRSVADVDLWPGILLETPNDGAVVGPTGACIIGIQFYKLKFGDRFYVEHIYEAGSFTHQQLQQLRRMTLSQIICLNTEVSQLPTNAMLFNSRNNPYINCRNVRGLDLSYWRE